MDDRLFPMDDVTARPYEAGSCCLQSSPGAKNSSHVLLKALLLCNRNNTHLLFVWEYLGKKAHSNGFLHHFIPQFIFAPEQVLCQKLMASHSFIYATSTAAFVWIKQSYGADALHGKSRGMSSWNLKDSLPSSFLHFCVFLIQALHFLMGGGDSTQTTSFLHLPCCMGSLVTCILKSLKRLK